MRFRDVAADVKPQSEASYPRIVMRPVEPIEYSGAVFRGESVGAEGYAAAENLLKRAHEAGLTPTNPALR